MDTGTENGTQTEECTDVWRGVPAQNYTEKNERGTRGLEKTPKVRDIMSTVMRSKWAWAGFVTAGREDVLWSRLVKKCNQRRNTYLGDGAF